MFMSSDRLLVDFLVYSICKIMSFVNRHVYFFLSNMDVFYVLLLPNCPRCVTVLKFWEQASLSYFWPFRRSHLIVYCYVKIFKPFVKLTKYPSIPSLLNDFITKGYWILSDIFFSVTLFSAVLGLGCSMHSSLVVESRSYSIVVCGLLVAVASLVLAAWALRRAGFSSCSSQALVHRLNSCGAWA